MRISRGLLAVLLAAPPAASAADEGMCFDGGEMEKGSARKGPLSPGDAAAMRKALEGVTSYRACVSFASLFQGFARGTVEHAPPDRTRTTIRHRRRHGTPVTLEVVRIGADTWYRTGTRWERLPAGEKLADAVTGVFMPTEPIEMARSFLAERTNLVRGGESKGRAGPCVVWDNPKAPGGVKDAFCFGSTDHLPYRYSGGGPSIEAYLQLELYDFGAKLDIRPPP